MRSLPSLAPFTALLSDLADALQQGSCCLVTANKGWTHLLFHNLRKRLRALGLRCEYVDGRPAPAETLPEDAGVMLTAISQLRRAVRGSVEGVVVALPHLDVMTASDSGWTNVAREVVPLLYEAPQVVLLGFRDPTVPLLAVVDKLFPRRFVVEQSFGGMVEGMPGAAASGPSTSEPAAESDKDNNPATVI